MYLQINLLQIHPQSIHYPLIIFEIILIIKLLINTKLYKYFISNLSIIKDIF